MKKTTKIKLALTLLFIFTLLFRLYFTLSLDTFSSSEAYFNQRIIENLVENKQLIFFDELSYGGRSLVYPPFFYLFMALLSLGSVTALKILPEILLSSTVLIAYLICKEISKDEWASFTGAILTSFIPLFLWETTNVLSLNSLFIPLLYLSLYSFLRLEKGGYSWIFIISLFLLALTSPNAYFFLLTLFFYFLLLAGGALNASRAEKEGALFAVLTIILFTLIIYKKAFLQYGLDIVTQNIPAVLLAERFRELSVTELTLATGILPLILGGFGLYFGMRKEKSKPLYLISALILAALSLLVLKLVTISTGLLFLGLGLALASSLSIHKIYVFLEKTKFSKFKTYITILFVILILTLSILPSYNQMRNLKGIPQEKIDDLLFIREIFDENAVILGNVDEGHLITSIAGKKNVMDNKFLLAPRPIERLENVDNIYSTWSQAKAQEYLELYDVDVIYLSEETKKLYNIEELPYTTGPCFAQEGRFIYVRC